MSSLLLPRCLTKLLRKLKKENDKSIDQRDGADYFRAKLIVIYQVGI